MREKQKRLAEKAHFDETQRVFSRAMFDALMRFAINTVGEKMGRTPQDVVRVLNAGPAVKLDDMAAVLVAAGFRYHIDLVPVEAPYGVDAFGRAYSYPEPS